MLKEKERLLNRNSNSDFSNFDLSFCTTNCLTNDIFKEMLKCFYHKSAANVKQTVWHYVAHAERMDLFVPLSVVNAVV